MRNLLSAGFIRLWHTKVFWFSCAFMASMTSATILNWYYENVTYGFHSRIDSCFFYFFGFIGIIIAAVCAMLIGTEHSDGGFRIRLIAGHTRAKIYLVNLTICSAAALIMCTAIIVPGLCLGLPLLGNFEMGWVKAALDIAGVYVMSLAYTALFTLLAVLVTGRAVSAVSALMLSLALLFSGMYLGGRLDARPTTDDLVSIGSEVVQTEKLPDPDYIPDGPKRQVLQLLYDFFPGGQAVQYATLKAERPEMLMVYDTAVFALSTGAGLVLFRRKDLK